MIRLILALACLALCVLAGQGQTTELDVSASVVGVIRSDASLLVPNRYATTGSIIVPQGDGYRVVLADVARPEWRFAVTVSGADGRATFSRGDWAFHGASLLKSAAGDGLLTVVAGP